MWKVTIVCSVAIIRIKNSLDFLSFFCFVYSIRFQPGMFGGKNFTRLTDIETRSLRISTDVVGKQNMGDTNSFKKKCKKKKTNLW